MFVSLLRIRDVKEPTRLLKRVGQGVPGAAVRPRFSVLHFMGWCFILRRLERVFSRTRARKHTRQLNDSKSAHRKLNLA